MTKSFYQESLSICTCVHWNSRYRFDTGRKLSWRAPIGHRRGPRANTYTKTWELTVNPVVDAYTKTQNRLKILCKTQKTQPTENQKNN